jgi:hypothetical protein
MSYPATVMRPDEAVLKPAIMRGLACAVGSQEPHDLASFHLEGEIVDDRLGTKPLGNRFKGNHVLPVL